ncbi:MAG: mechanosensitive ion channel [Verrucomicrobia bacterium]|nr:mechanosensitive ion channel [Verrucomicrobiota bacterium]MDA1086922.1 mechanosensitive ion channel [Verrucomicrobiota bacterium]
MQNVAHFFASLVEFQLIQLGAARITVGSILVLVLLVAAINAASALIGRKLLAPALARTRVDEGTRFSLLRLVHYVLVCVGTLMAFQIVGIDLSGLVVLFGFLSVGIGFGLQNITSNFISGLILLFERPIKVGDRIMVGETEGDVLEINMRSTTVRSLNNIAMIVPNSDFISSVVTNWSHRDPKIRLELEVGVAYESDPEAVRTALQEVIDATPLVLKSPAAAILHMGFGDSAWNICVRVWIAHPKDHPVVRSAINWAIVEKFREHGIEIPFPQRDLHVRSPLPVPIAEMRDV